MSTSNRRGLTIVELLVALTMLSIVLFSVTSLVTRTQRDFVRQREVIRHQENVRLAEQIITRFFRTARADPMRANVGRIDIDPMGRGAFDNIRIRSDFNPTNGNVNDPLEDALIYTARDTLYVRWRGGQPPQPVAYPVRALQFEYFRADDTPVTTPAQFPLATKVKFTVTVPPYVGSADYIRRESWVYFRN